MLSLVRTKNNRQKFVCFQEPEFPYRDPQTFSRHVLTGAFSPGCLPNRLQQSLFRKRSFLLYFGLQILNKLSEGLLRSRSFLTGQGFLVDLQGRWVVLLDFVNQPHETVRVWIIGI